MDTRSLAGYAARWTNEGTSGEKTVTEAEWQACTDPDKMLEFLRDKASDRKFRLFATGSAHIAGHHHIDFGESNIDSHLSLRAHELVAPVTSPTWLP
jgi:hypothetical protein